MGIYTDVIRERERADREMVREAEDRMAQRRHRDRDAGGDDAQEALGILLGKYHLTVNPVQGYGDVTEMLDLALDPIDVIYCETDMTDPDWKRGGSCLLAFMEDGRAAAVWPSFGAYRYACPAGNERGWVSAKTRFRPVAYAIQRPMRMRSLTMSSLFSYVLQLVSARDFTAIGAASLLAVLLGLVAPKLNQRVLEEIVPMGTDGLSLLARAMILYLTAGFVRGCITAAKNICMSRMKIRIASETQSAVLGRILLLPQRYFMRVSTGKLSRQIAYARSLSDQVLEFVLGGSLTALFSLAYIPQMDSFSAILLIPALVVLALKCAWMAIVSFFRVENEKRRQNAETEERNFTYTALRGVQRIKESGAERRVYAKWVTKYQNMLGCDLDQPAVLKLEDTALSLITALGTALLLSLIVPNGIEKADYIAFNASFALITTAVTALMGDMRKLLLMKPVMNQLQELIAAAPENPEGQRILRKVRGEYRLENVSYTYEGSTVGCLKDVSLHIRPGEKVAVVGESGCGKSTLLKMLLGILKPDTGGVFIDGVPLGSVHLRALRRHISAVLQFSRVMPGTVFSNIAFSPRPVSREDAEAAAEKADLTEFIRSLPLGFDTEISDSNTGGFSGGQRQKLLLARALASRPDVLILDEATSALDNISQNRVLDAVYREKCTVIMVAHRLSTVRKCDRIVLLKDGRIAEEGTFDELMALDGEFRELMRRQELSK